MSRRYRILILVATLLSVAWAYACGDGGTAPDPPPPPNRAPVASGSIPAQTVMVGHSATVDVASYFSDPDGDALTYAATSSDAAVASVELSGSSVTITGVAVGTATLTVTARDPAGLSATLSAAVTVAEANLPPVALFESGSFEAYEGEKLASNAAEFFEDPDGDLLTFSVATTDANVVAVGIVASFFSITAASEGTATMTLAATDPHGQSASIVWTFVVEAAEPVIPHDCIPGTEQPLAMGDSVSGTLSSVVEWDCFAVEVGGGKDTAPFRVTAFTEGDTDTSGALFDSNYDPIAVDHDGGEGSNFQLVGMVDAGRYIVGVTSGSFGGDYLLKVDDHGDSPSSATPVPDSVKGSFVGAGNVDFFEVTVPVAGVLEVSTTGDVDTRGTLYDDSGGALATDDDGGQSVNFLIRLEVERGDYHVRVEGSTSGNYVFRVGGAGVRTGPELVFTEVRPSEVTVQAGGPPVAMHFSLANAGDTPSEETEIRMLVSSDSTITTSDVELSSDLLEVMPAGISDEHLIELELSAKTPPATVYFGMCVDPVSREPNTDNNCSPSVKVTIAEASRATAADASLTDVAGHASLTDLGVLMRELTARVIYRRGRD